MRRKSSNNFVRLPCFYRIPMRQYCTVQYIDSMYSRMGFLKSDLDIYILYIYVCMRLVPDSHGMGCDPPLFSGMGTANKLFLQQISNKV